MSTDVAETIGDYVIEAELGRGAHGVVYRAHHRSRPDAPVALKVVAGRGNADRLLLEPAVLSRLDHPNIVGIEDYFLLGEDLVLALEYIDGDNLQSLLDQGRVFTQAEVRDLLVQMASALAEAHGKDVVHRDIKPSNILVARGSDGPRYVLTDFGIGQLSEGIQTRKRTGGTYAYMAPEQLRGRPGPQSDLWALGVVAYRLLAGSLPFPGPSLNDLSHQIQYAAPPPPRSTTAETIDAELERVVLRLLDKSLEERVASASELLRQLGVRRSDLKGRPTKRPTKGGVSLDRRLDDQIKWRRFLVAVCILLYLLIGSGLLTGLLKIGGMVLFFTSQVGDRWSKRGAFFAATAALLLVAISVDLQYFHSDWDVHLIAYLIEPLNSFWGFLRAAIAGPNGYLGVYIVSAVLLLALYASLFAYAYLPAVGGAYFSALRRLHRERLLRDVANGSRSDTAYYLDVLGRSVDSRFEDVGLHLKYAEALFACGRIREAAVEARLLLQQDEYHFNGNLLLANAYFQLRLWDECLKVSGYCFEFSDLREQCRRRRDSS
jgi:serine/threonine-protein kinase